MQPTSTRFSGTVSKDGRCSLSHQSGSISRPKSDMTNPINSHCEVSKRSICLKLRFLTIHHITAMLFAIHCAAIQPWIPLVGIRIDLLARAVRATPLLHLACVQHPGFMSSSLAHIEPSELASTESTEGKLRLVTVK